MVRRLVEHEEVRARGDDDREREPAPLAAREHGDRLLVLVPAGEEELAEQRLRLRRAQPGHACAHWSTRAALVELDLLLREVRRLDAVAERACRRRLASPRIVSSSVVLPEPFGPTSATCSPRSSANVASSSSTPPPAPRREPFASSTVRPLRAGFRNSKPSVAPRASSAISARRLPLCLEPPICVSFACACFALTFLYAEALDEALEARDVGLGLRSAVFGACSASRAAFSRRQACHGPGKKVAWPRDELERRGRDRLEEPAVVGDEDHGGVERRELALEPLEARDVEVVRRLVEQQQVGVAAERARERGARQLAAREGAQRPVEVVVGEAEPAHDRAVALAPAVAAGVLEPRLRLASSGAASRGRASPAAIACSSAAQLLLDARQVARRPRARTRAASALSLERRPLVVQRDARPLLERELAAVLLGLAREHAEQRRLAGAVRPGERDAVAALDLERDAVEERRRRRAPCAGWRRSRLPWRPRVGSRA